MEDIEFPINKTIAAFAATFLIISFIRFFSADTQVLEALSC